VSLAELRAVLSPPDAPRYTGSNQEWTAAEMVLSLVFPPDFKDYVRVYGDRQLAEWCHILSPIGQGVELAPDLSASLSSLPAMVAGGVGWQAYLSHVAYNLGAYEADQEEERRATGHNVMFPYRFYPDPGGIFPWAYLDDNTALYWLTDGEPDTWPVVRAEVHEGMTLFPMSMTSYLAAWLRNDLDDTGPFYPD